MDAEYRQQLAAVPQRELITFHNAFDLIARRYGLKIVAHLTDIELTPGGEVTPEHFMEAVHAIRQFKLNAVYAEPEFPDVILNSIHRETGVEVLQLDPLGSPRQAGYQTYQEMMRSNLKTLVKGQRRAGEIEPSSGESLKLHSPPSDLDAAPHPLTTTGVPDHHGIVDPH